MWRAGALALAGCYSAIIMMQNYRRRDEAPHVWSWVPFMGSAVEFSKNPVAFLRAQQLKHGDIFTVVVGGNRMVFACDHTMWNTIFRMRRELSFEPVGFKVLNSAFDVAMSKIVSFCALPEGHEVDKQLTTHMSGAGLEGLARTASSALHLALGRMLVTASATDADGYSGVAMYSAVARAVFDSTTEIFYGPDFHTDQSFHDFKTFDAQFPFLAGGAPKILFPRAMKALAGLCDLLDSTASYASASAPASLLIRARREVFIRSEEQGDISRQDHYKFQAVMIWAMLANTQPAIYWALYHILRDPTAQAAVRAELAATGSENEVPLQVMEKLQRGDLSHLPVLNSCILESLRLATGSLTVREVKAPCSLRAGDKELMMRTGDRVAIFPPLLHFNEALFPDSLEYKWQRFIDTDKDGAMTLNNLARSVMPFGGGESMCPGRHFAKNEIAQFVVGALMEYDCKLHPNSLNEAVPGFDPSRVGLGIYPPEHDSVHILLRPRGSRNNSSFV